MRWNGSFNELQQYLRDYANLTGEVVPYETQSVLHLLLALVDNLQENALEVDLRETVPKAVNVRRAAFLAGLARLAGNG